jgi:hypothetical protein
MTDQTPTQEVDEYSPEELAKAASALKDFTPEQYLALHSLLSDEYKQAREALSTLPEAGGIVFCELVNNKGMSFNLTGRGVTTVDAIKNLAEGVKFAKAMFGWSVKSKYAPEQPSDLTPINIPASAARLAQPAATPGIVKPVMPPLAPALSVQPPAPEPTYENVEGQTGDTAPIETGIDVLNKIKVDEGKVEFSVGKFTYPFSDSRGPAVVASLFDQDIGFTPEHFIDGARFDPSQWSGILYADWEKVERFSKMKKKNVFYYNIVRIHR